MKNAVTQRRVFERYLTDAEVTQLLGCVAKRAGDLARRDQAWLGLLLATGLRVGSLAGLNLVDAEQALATKQLQVRDEVAKGGRGYAISMNSKALAALAELLRLRTAMGGVDTALIVGRNGYRLSVRSYQSRMQYWVEASGISAPASPHWLRHTLAKRVMKRSESKDPQAIAQVVLGQRCRQSTVLYTLPDREDIDKAMEAAA